MKKDKKDPTGFWIELFILVAPITFLAGLIVLITWISGL